MNERNVHVMYLNVVSTGLVELFQNMNTLAKDTFGFLLFIGSCDQSLRSHFLQ